MLFLSKNKLAPKLPKNIDDLKDLPEEFKTTTAKKSFLVSPVDMFNKFLLFAADMRGKSSSQSQVKSKLYFFSYNISSQVNYLTLRMILFQVKTLTFFN